MNEVLAISLQSMQGDMTRVEQIGMNLANALTPGYKRGVAVQSPVGASFAAHLAGVPGNAAGPTGAAATQAVSLRSDTRAGNLKATGQPLDVALAGKGYFEVATDSGPAYTRQGSFRLDGSGRLVTAQGYPVMGQSGEIVLPTATPSITTSGALVGPGSSEDAPLAQLKIVEFDAASQQERIGEGLLSAGEGMTLVSAKDVQVRQGYIENSNVASTHEMTQLIQAMRHFETMHKVAQGYDDMLGTAIRKLGDNS